MRLFLILVAAVCFAQPAPASDWHTGVGRDAARSGLSPEIGPAAPHLLWEGSRTAIISQQGVAGEGLFIVSRVASFTIPTGTWIVAHDLGTGEEAWAIQLPYEGPDEWRSRVSAVRDGKVYATRAGGESQPGYLYALHPADGSILWRSEDPIDEATTESAAFAADGDLIIGNWDSVVRIEQADGTILWSVPRSTPSSNGLSAAVSGDRAYIWEPSAEGPKVTAIDIEAGSRLYSSDPISGGYVQQLGLFCGLDGTVYAPRTQNNPSTDYLVALEDTGTALAEKWRVPLGYVPFASFGIGPDGTIYSYSRDLEVVRLDPVTGGELDRSIVIGLDSPMQPRMAVDADGNVYVTNGGFDNGRVYAFTADLKLRWDEDLYRVNLGGPVLAGGGTLLVCGTGTDVRAYGRDPAYAADPIDSPPWPRLEPARPNPFTGSTEMLFELAKPGDVSLGIYDAAGRRIRTLLPPEHRPAGVHRVRWDGRDDAGRNVGSGIYLYRLCADGGRPAGRIQKVR